MGKSKFLMSFIYAISGINYVFRSERNMKIHGLAALMVIVFGVIIGVSRIEWGILSITIFMVLVAESINTAVEKTIDLVTTEYHPWAESAKNVAAGAVLLTAINAIIIAIIIFGHHLF